jgi:hypothetical protein
MLQEIQVLEEQYRDAHKAWLDAVRELNEIRPKYMAAKEIHDRVREMHLSLKEHGYAVEAEALEPMRLNFEKALAKFAEPYRKADAECRLADKAAEDCGARLDAAKRAVGHPV